MSAETHTTPEAGPLTSTVVTLAGGPPLIISKHDRNAEIMSSKADATGMVFWAAAEVLAQLVYTRHADFAGCRVAELGCGSGVAGVAACQYAREVLFTDAVDAVAALALNNALANGAVRRGDVDAASCVASSCVLRWGVDDAEVAAAHGTFDIVLASEVLYVHWDDPTPLVDLASCLVRTGCGLLGAGGDPPPRAGVFVFVYTPRYRGMGAAVREACARLGVHMRTMNRASILSEAQVAAGLHFSVRLVCVSPWLACVERWCEGVSPGGASDDEDWFNGDTAEEADPLGAIGSDVFAGPEG